MNIEQTLLDESFKDIAVHDPKLFEDIGEYIEALEGESINEELEVKLWDSIQPYMESYMFLFEVRADDESIDLKKDKDGTYKSVREKDRPKWRQKLRNAYDRAKEFIKTPFRKLKKAIKGGTAKRAWSEKETKANKEIAKAIKDPLEFKRKHREATKGATTKDVKAITQGMMSARLGLKGAKHKIKANLPFRNKGKKAKDRKLAAAFGRGSKTMFKKAAKHVYDKEVRKQAGQRRTSRQRARA